MAVLAHALAFCCLAPVHEQEHFQCIQRNVRVVTVTISMLAAQLRGTGGDRTEGYWISADTAHDFATVRVFNVNPEHHLQFLFDRLRLS